MKNNSYKTYSKNKNIPFKCLNDIHFEDKKEKVDNTLKISAVSSLKVSCIQKRFHLDKGQTPIISKDNKLILIVENKYEKKFQKGKSPFFISDKLNFKTAFKFQGLGMIIKPKHLGLCDYYKKIKENVLAPENDINSDDSKTPRFNKD